MCFPPVFFYSFSFFRNNKAMKNLRYFLPAFLLAAIVIAGCKSSTSPSNNNGTTGNGPAITAFTAMPSTITIGDSSALSWTLDGTQTSISIDQGIGDQTNNSNDSIHVFPGMTTTYTLTAKNSNGTSTKTVTVTVNNPSDPNSPPIPTGLNASAGSSSPSTINLAWTEPSGSVVASHFIIERHLAGQTFDTISAAAPGPGSYSDAQLYPSFVYTYRVKSVSSAGAASGWSNSATAVAPGAAPNIASITLSPATVPTLTPGGTQQFTATAFDQSGNALPIAQGSFIWTTSNGLIANVNAFGLATAGTTQGGADIYASLAQQGNLNDTIASNGVTVTVSNKSSATTAVLFYGSAASDFTNYAGALAASGVAFDPLNDFSNGGPPQFTIAQLTPYNRVVVLIGAHTNINNNAESELADYAALGGKTLVILGGGNNENLTGTLMNDAGVSIDGYTGIDNINLPVQGQSGTAFAGLAFSKQDGVDYVDDITLNASSTFLPALIGTMVSDNSQVIIAIQGTITGASGSSKLLYVGGSIDLVDPPNQGTFVKDFMTF